MCQTDKEIDKTKKTEKSQRVREVKQGKTRKKQMGYLYMYVLHILNKAVKK